MERAGAAAARGDRRLRVTRLRLLAAAAALAAPALIAPAAPALAQAQAQRDWSRVVAQTPEGGYRMGNPDAPVKLVEYLSLTCSHCAHFAEEGTPALIGSYVRTGRVSLEYRNYVRDAYDLAAAAISRCAAPADYFALNHALFAAQDEWMGRVRGLPEAQRRGLQQLQPIEGVRRIVSWIGLDEIAARHGVTAAEAQACLSTPAGVQRIIEMRRAADAAGVEGTPTFTINGERSAAQTWPQIEPIIRQAVGG